VNFGGLSTQVCEALSASRHYTKKDRRIGIEFRPSSQATAHGGQMAINAVAGGFGLWQRVRNEPRLDPRIHTGKGYDSVVYVTALLFGFTSGGDSLADAERLEDDESPKLPLGVRKFEGTAINCNGDLALSWQTLWAGPFMCDAVPGTPAGHKFRPRKPRPRKGRQRLDARHARTLRTAR
jgi:hypothetical protein